MPVFVVISQNAIARSGSKRSKRDMRGALNRTEAGANLRLDRQVWTDPTGVADAVSLDLRRVIDRVGRHESAQVKIVWIDTFQPR
jgi:hypothetical protein